MTDPREFQLDFWTKFKTKLEATGKIPTLQTPQPHNWYDVRIGRSNILLNNVCNTQKNFVCVKLYIRNQVAGIYYPALEARRNEINQVLGCEPVWEVAFEVVPMLMEARTYLMRWNPAISSFTEKDFETCVENSVHGMFRMDWSIYEWQEARRGDFFYMMRTGDDKAGIVFSGQFLSDPYPADDWAGSTKRRMYVDMICYNAESGSAPHISLEKLQTAIPAKDWQKGHSGELLSEEITTQLDELWGEE